MVQARCMKCRKQVEMKNPVETKTKRGTLMYKGKCPYCSTNVARIGK